MCKHCGPGRGKFAVGGLLSQVRGCRCVNPACLLRACPLIQRCGQRVTTAELRKNPGAAERARAPGKGRSSVGVLWRVLSSSAGQWRWWRRGGDQGVESRCGRWSPRCACRQGAQSEVCQRGSRDLSLAGGLCAGCRRSNLKGEWGLLEGPR